MSEQLTEQLTEQLVKIIIHPQGRFNGKGPYRYSFSGILVSPNEIANLSSDKCEPIAPGVLIAEGDASLFAFALESLSVRPPKRRTYDLKDVTMISKL